MAASYVGNWGFAGEQGEAAFSGSVVGELSRRPSGELEVNRDSRLELNRLAIVRIGLVAPLLHRVGGGLREQRVARDELERIDFALLINDRLQHNGTLQLAGTCGLRINGMDAVNHLIVSVVFWNFKQFRRFRGSS